MERDEFLRRGHLAVVNALRGVIHLRPPTLTAEESRLVAMFDAMIAFFHNPDDSPDVAAANPDSDEAMVERHRKETADLQAQHDTEERDRRAKRQAEAEAAWNKWDGVERRVTVGASPTGTERRLAATPAPAPAWDGSDRRVTPGGSPTGTERRSAPMADGRLQDVA